MRSSKSVLSAMLGIAFLAMPITAAARSNNQRRHAPAPASHPAPAFRPAPARASLRPAPASRFNPVARNFPHPAAPAYFKAQNNWKLKLAPTPPQRHAVMQPRPVAPAGWHQHDPVPPARFVPPSNRDYTLTERNHEPDRDDFRTVCDQDGDNCRQVPYRSDYAPYRYEQPRPQYRPVYQRDYRDYDDMPYVCDEDGDNCSPNAAYDGSYNNLYGPNWEYDYSPMAGESLLAYRTRLLSIRANAQARYRVALARHDRRTANALHAWIRDLNKRLYNLDRRMAAQGYGNGYGYSPAGSLGSYAGGYANPYANNYGQYGYGTGGVYSSLAPMISNFIP